MCPSWPWGLHTTDKHTQTLVKYYLQQCLYNTVNVFICNALLLLSVSHCTYESINLEGVLVINLKKSTTVNNSSTASNILCIYVCAMYECVLYVNACTYIYVFIHVHMLASMCTTCC